MGPVKRPAARRTSAAVAERDADNHGRRGPRAACTVTAMAHSGTNGVDSPRGPILLCAGTDAGAAARLAEPAAALLRRRPAVVLATWRPPLMTSGLDAAMDALYDVHAE